MQCFLQCVFPFMDCSFERGLLFISMIVEHIEGEYLLTGAICKHGEEMVYHCSGAPSFLWLWELSKFGIKEKRKRFFLIKDMLIFLLLINF